MKYALTGLLLAGATSAFVFATPALAQVAGNPGDLHTPTPLHRGGSSEHLRRHPGYGGPLGPLGVMASPITALVAALNGGFTGGACVVSQDFNGRLTALCGL